MAEVWLAPEVREVALPIIQRHHKHLWDAEIAFVFTDATMTSKGKTVLGKAQKATPLMRGLVEAAGAIAPDFIITINSEQWSRMPLKARRALVDHELCHCVREFGEEGNFVMRGHDVEEFSQIVERHGLWQVDLQLMGDAIRQLSFDLPPIGTTLEMPASDTVGRDLHRAAASVVGLGRQLGDDYPEAADRALSKIRGGT